MQQHCQQQAATGVIEDPCEEDRQRDSPGDERDGANQVANKAGAKAHPIKVRTRDEEEGQVPQAPERSQQERAHQRTRTLLQAREREAPPAWFLPQWSLSDEEKSERGGEQSRGWRRLQAAIAAPRARARSGVPEAHQGDERIEESQRRAAHQKRRAGW